MSTNKVEKEVNAGQMVMFTQQSLAQFDPTIGKIFGVKTTEKVNAKTGQVLQTDIVAMGKRKDVALALDLVGKDNKEALDARILDAKRTLMRGAKGEIAAYEDNVVFGKRVVREMANGSRRITWVFDEIDLSKSAAELATVAGALGWSVRELLERIEKFKEEKRAAAAKPAQASVEPAVSSEPADTRTQADKDAAALAEMEEAERAIQEANAHQAE